MKLMALMGGGDWTDASVEHLLIPDTLDIVGIDGEKEKWNKWYREDYCPNLQRGTKVDYIPFSKWLITKCGAREATESDIIEVWDD